MEVSVRGTILGIGTELAARANEWKTNRLRAPGAGFWSDDVETMKTTMPGSCLQLSGGRIAWVPFDTPVKLSAREGLLVRVYVVGSAKSSYYPKEWFDKECDGCYKKFFPGFNKALGERIEAVPLVFAGKPYVPLRPTASLKLGQGLVPFVLSDDDDDCDDQVPEVPMAEVAAAMLAQHSVALTPPSPPPYTCTCHSARPTSVG